MLKYIMYLVLAVVVAGAVFGGVHLYRVAVKNKKEMAKYAGAEVDVNKKLGKVLVVYYSLTGHTKDIANRIAEQTGADIYEIRTRDPLPKGAMLHVAVKQQLKSKDYPVLAGNMPDFKAYDVIFVGAPVWWYTAATPVLSFLKQADFGGKKVVPFSTQGSNVGTFLEDFSKNAKNANLQTYQSFNNMGSEYDAAVDNKIAEWLNGL